MEEIPALSCTDLVTCLMVTSLSLTLTSCYVQRSEGRSLVGVVCSLVTLPGGDLPVPDPEPELLLCAEE